MDKVRFELLFSQWLERSDLTQSQLARRLRVHRATVNKWLSGANQIPYSRLLECAELFSLSEQELTDFLQCAGHPPIPQPAASGHDEPQTAKVYDVALHFEPDLIFAPSTLFGRESELAQIASELDSGHHVLLTGYGGSGKSALAATAARALLSATSAPVLWLTNPGDLDTLFEAMLLPFQATDSITGLTGQGRLVAVRRALDRQNLGLVLIDDLRDLTLLPPLRRILPPNVPLLITSRQDSANVDFVLRLDALDGEACRALIAEQAANSTYSHDEYLDDPDTFRLCQRLKGYPLGLVIAAAWMRQRRRRAGDLIALFEEANQAPLDLAMPPSFIEHGQQTAKLLLDETFRTLSKEAQPLYRLLGSLDSPQISLPLLTILADKPEPLVAEALAELERWNFIEQPQPALFRLHDMLHDYAGMLYRRYRRPDPTPLISAVVRFSDDFRHDFAGLHRDLAHILFAAEHADDERCLQIMRALFLDGYFDTHGHRRRLLNLLERMIEYVRGDERAERKEILHHLLSKLGNAHFDRAEYAQAVAAYGEALHSAYNETRHAMLLGLLGKAYGFKGQLAESESHFERAQIEVSRLNDPYLQGFLLEQRVHTAGHREDHGHARKLAQEQVAIGRRLYEDDPTLSHAHFYCNALINESTAEIRMGLPSFNDTFDLLKQAEALAEQEQNADMLVHVAWSMGELFHAGGRRSEAASYLKRARDGYREQGRLRDLRDVESFMEKHGYREEAPTTSERSIP